MRKLGNTFRIDSNIGRRQKVSCYFQKGKDEENSWHDDKIGLLLELHTQSIVVKQLNKYFNVATPSFTIERSSGNYTKTNVCICTETGVI